MTKKEIESVIVKRAVDSLKEFGYPHVNNENIFTDDVYKMIFHNMLKENRGHAGFTVDSVLDKLIEITK